MTEFDAKIVKMNQRTDTAIAKIVKKCDTRVDKNMVDRVLRPFIHTMNECEVKNVDVEQVFDALISTTVAMCSEYFTRTIPKDNNTLLQENLATLLDEFSQGLVGSLSVNFGVTIELATAAQPVPPASPLHS